MSTSVIASTNGQTDESISASDEAVAAAVAAAAKRKAAKEAGTPTGTPATTGTTDDGKKKRIVLTSEQRIERAANIEKDRAARAKARKEKSEAKNAEAKAARGTPHMSKVEKAGAGLAPMDVDTEALFNEIKAALTQAQIDILTAHLAFHSRAESTKGSLELKLEPGTPVRIVSGPAKFIGKEGVVAKWQRVHCYITVPGVNKPLYLFNANVTPIKAEPAPLVHDEGPEPESAPAAGEQTTDEAAAA